MGKYGYTSEFMSGGRILSKGQITDLSKGFELPGKLPFSMYVRPKVASDDLDTVIDVVCYQEEQSSSAPFSLQEWSPLAVITITPNNELLNEYDIWWGAGTNVTEL